MVAFVIKLILAHILGDFIFQPTKWVKDKEAKKHKSKYLYFHILVHLIVLLVVLQFDVTYWIGIIIIGVSHYVIDLIKLHVQTDTNKRILFLIDQILHLGIILLVVNYYNQGMISFDFLFNQKFHLFCITLLLVTKVVSVSIDIMISKWKIEHDNAIDSLENAGSYIGMIERLLIVFFVILGHWEGVGFLLAAKSIFRFGDLTNAKDRKLTEYILIGTLLSFGFAMVIGQLFLEIIKML